jgi:hypothetical protein
VVNTLGVDKFDTLILSLPGIILENDENYLSDEFPVDEKTRTGWTETWKVIKICNIFLTLDF